MKQKIVDLKSQMDEIKDEIDVNEELGEKVTKVVEKKASPAEFSKYQLFTGELNKIIGLLLILTQRMHRYEMMLNDLDMSEEADRQQRVSNLGSSSLLLSQGSGEGAVVTWLVRWTSKLKVGGLRPSPSHCVVSLDKKPYSTLSLSTKVFIWVVATYCWR